MPSLRRGEGILGINKELKALSKILLLERQHAVLLVQAVGQLTESEDLRP